MRSCRYTESQAGTQQLVDKFSRADAMLAEQGLNYSAIGPVAYLCGH